MADLQAAHVHDEMVIAVLVTKQRAILNCPPCTRSTELFGELACDPMSS
jgi:hypothetical protein